MVASLRANGEKRTVAHGLWSGPPAAGRYLRLSVPDEIVPMADNMVRLHNMRQGVAPSEEYGSDVSGFLSDSESDDEVPEHDSEDDVVHEVPERVLNPRRRVSPAPSRQRASSRRAAGSESAPGSSRRRSSRAPAGSRP